VVSVKRPLRFGVVCGALIGTVGLAAEWGWSHIWMPLPWPAEILPETFALGLAMALAGSLIGAWVGARLGSERIPYSRPLRWSALTAAVAVGAMLAFPLFTQAETGLSARVVLSDVAAAPQRTAMATITLRPRDAAKNATWLTATAWQGGGLVVDRLRNVGPGVYKTTKPIPLHGDWKTMIRLHTGNAILGLPIYAPADPAIPLPAVRAPRAFSRPFFSDHELLQRESKTRDASITYGAYAVVLTCTLLLLAMLAWGLHRVGVTAGKRRLPLPGSFDPPAPPEPDPEPEPDASLPPEVWPASLQTYAGRQ
jgi:hypothetical protein